MKAVWNGEVIAESNDTVVVERNHYFPSQSIKQQYVESSAHTSVCPWKGLANYYTIKVGDKRNDNAAWVYQDPLPAAQNIRGRIAFWKGVTITE